jgi:hypothetical protein
MVMKPDGTWRPFSDYRRLNLVTTPDSFCYLDNILIASSSKEEHHRHLQLVLQRLQQYRLALNMEKCELGRKQVDFLGHHITAEGAAPIASHVEAVQNFPRPQNKKQLQSFLVLVNFYRCFIQVAARILLSLTDALGADWVWSPAMQHSFQLINDTLASVAVLTHSDSAAEVNLAVDATNTHIGAVLHQRCTGSGGDLWDFLARSWMRPS